MKAKVQPKIFSRDRVNLENVIPVEVPFSLEIDVASVCNLTCNFCYRNDKETVKKSNVPFGIMEMNLYKKIIDDLNDFKELPKKLKLFGFGEPLINKDFCEMVKYAKKKFPQIYVETVTNGTLLNKQLTKELIESGINRINISVESLSSKGYYEMTGTNINFDDYVENIRDLYKNKKDLFIYIKLIDIGNLQDMDRKLFYDTFGDICDEIFIETATNAWKDNTTVMSSSENTEIGNYGQKIGYKKVCTLLFTRFIINFDGEVSLCCTDWKRQCDLGNVSLDSLYNIWHGEKLKKYQLIHLRGERETIPLCNNCTVLSTATTDDIDAYANELIAKLNI